MLLVLKQKGFWRGCAPTDRICLGFCWLMFGVFPLFVTPGWFFTLNLSKFCFFAGAVLLFVCLLFWKPAHHPCMENRWFAFLSLTDIGMAGLCGVSLVSGVLSEFFPDTLYGCPGRYHGMAALALYAAVYFCLSRFCGSKRGILPVFMAASSLVALLAVLNVFQVDPFQAYDHVALHERELFLSTIGNRNFLSSFFCLSVPVALVMFCAASNRKKAAWCAAALTLNFAGLFASNSDSGFAGAFVLFGAGAILLCRSVLICRRFLCSVFLFLMVGQLLRVACECDADVLFQFSGAAKILMDRRMIVPACLLLAVCLIFSLNKPHRADRRRVAWFQRSAAGLFGAAVLASCIMFVWFTFFDRQTGLGEWETYFRFSGQWGNMRGSAWMYGMQAFGMLGAKDILIGTGPDTILQLFSKLFSDDMANGQLLVFDSVHNEYLQYLITTGILGLASYLILVAGSCVQGLRHANGSRFVVACSCSVMCYAVQGMFNISMISTTPLLFVMLALISSELRIQRAGFSGESK